MGERDRERWTWEREIGRERPGERDRERGTWERQRGRNIHHLISHLVV